MAAALKAAGFLTAEESRKAVVGKEIAALSTRIQTGFGFGPVPRFPFSPALRRRSLLPGFSFSPYPALVVCPDKLFAAFPCLLIVSSLIIWKF